MAEEKAAKRIEDLAIFAKEVVE